MLLALASAILSIAGVLVLATRGCDDDLFFVVYIILLGIAMGVTPLLAYWAAHWGTLGFGAVFIINIFLIDGILYPSLLDCEPDHGLDTKLLNSISLVVLLVIGGVLLWFSEPLTFLIPWFINTVLIGVTSLVNALE